MNRVQNIRIEISNINNIFPLIDAGPLISAALLGIHIEISASL